VQSFRWGVLEKILLQSSVGGKNGGPDTFRRRLGRRSKNPAHPKNLGVPNYFDRRTGEKQGKGVLETFIIEWRGSSEEEDPVKKGGDRVLCEEQKRSSGRKYQG